MNKKLKLTYVVDASVVLKWFHQVKEEELQKAYKLREDYLSRQIDLIAPELLIYEVANVLHHKEELAEEEIVKAVASLYKMQILQSSTEEVMREAIKWARKYDITVYDSTYLSMASHYRFPFITADEKLWNKIKKHAGVILISEYALKQ